MSLVFDIELPRRDFTVKLKANFEKSTTGIFGPSGAGKTTLFRLLSGLERPAKGRIVLNDTIITDIQKRIFIPPYRRKIGLVFQEKLLFPHLSVRQNILFGKKYVKHSRISFTDAVELLGLSSLLDSMPHMISGGEQQRTAIARALMTSPELLLLDEPFNAVDSSMRKTILPYLRKVRDELDIPMLLISHDLPDIQRLTDNIFLIENGICRGYGSIYELFEENGVLSNQSGLVNTIKLNSPQKIDDGLFQSSIEGCSGITVKTPFAPSQSFMATILPSEIALSLHHVPDISIQNQIRGKIQKIFERNNSIYCLIDFGVNLLAKITPDSARHLHLKPGDQVYCLFKSHSLSL